MEQYQNGAETKEQILRACQTLFYEKGYEETTYNDICALAHVNRGLIPYHFKSKDAIKQLIGNQEGKKLFQQADALSVKLNYLGQYVFTTYLYWYKFFHDAKYRRFFSFSFINSDDLTVYDVQAYYQVPSVETLSPTAELNLALFSGQQAILSAYISRHFDRFTYEQVAGFELHMNLSSNPASIRHNECVIKKVEDYTADRSECI